MKMDENGGEKPATIVPKSVDVDSTPGGENTDSSTETAAGAGASASQAHEPMDGVAAEPPKLSPKSVSKYTYGILSLANGAIKVSVPMNDD